MTFSGWHFFLCPVLLLLLLLPTTSSSFLFPTHQWCCCCCKCKIHHLPCTRLFFSLENNFHKGFHELGFSSVISGMESDKTNTYWWINIRVCGLVHPDILTMTTSVRSHFRRRSTEDKALSRRQVFDALWGHSHGTAVLQMSVNCKAYVNWHVTAGRVVCSWSCEPSRRLKSCWYSRSCFDW